MGATWRIQLNDPCARWQCRLYVYRMFSTRIKSGCRSYLTLMYVLLALASILVLRSCRMWLIRDSLGGQETLSVCAFLFLLHVLNRLTVELEFCMCVDHHSRLCQGLGLGLQFLLSRVISSTLARQGVRHGAAESKQRVWA